MFYRMTRKQPFGTTYELKIMSEIYINFMRYSSNQLKSDLYFVLEEFENVFLKLVDEGETLIESNFDLKQSESYLLNDSFIAHYYNILFDYYRENPTQYITNHVILAMTRIKKVCQFCLSAILSVHPLLKAGLFEDLYKNSKDFIEVIASKAHKDMLKGVNLKLRVYNDQSVLTSMREYERKLYDLPPRRYKSKL